jgi:hypothetical protein
MEVADERVTADVANEPGAEKPRAEEARESIAVEDEGKSVRRADAAREIGEGAVGVARAPSRHNQQPKLGVPQRCLSDVIGAVAWLPAAIARAHSRGPLLPTARHWPPALSGRRFRHPQHDTWWLDGPLGDGVSVR